MRALTTTIATATHVSPSSILMRRRCSSRSEHPRRKVVPGSVPRAEERMSDPEPRIYAYGIVRLHDGDDLAAPVPLHGLHGGAVRALACGRLAALVSDLPPQASAPLDDIWRDPDRIKSLVLEHHRVLHGVVLERTVLPLHFGAVFSDDDGVATALAMHYDALWEALDRVDGAREWGVKIFCDQDVLHSHLSQDTDGVGAGPAQIDAPSAGRPSLCVGKWNIGPRKTSATRLSAASSKAVGSFPPPPAPPRLCASSRRQSMAARTRWFATARSWWRASRRTDSLP